MLVSRPRRPNLAISVLAYSAIAASCAGCSAAPEEGAAAADLAPATSAMPITGDGEWRRAMSRVPPPRDGCFVATRPRIEWEEVPCIAPLEGTRSPPESAATLGTRPIEAVAGAAATTRLNCLRAAPVLSWAEGSFPSVSGVTYEIGADPAYFGLPMANVYSLQLNTTPFATALCANAPSSNCQGWQQFVYQSQSATFPYPNVHIEYWLLNYDTVNNTCPSSAWQHGNAGACVMISSSGSQVPSEPIGNLQNMALIATAGATDMIQLSDGDGHLYGYSQASFLNLDLAWRGAEFNVLGIGNGAQANFSGTPTIVAQILIDSAVHANACRRPSHRNVAPRSDARSELARARATT